MAWIEFHAARIKRLKKFNDFRRQMNISTNEALGFLGSFWGEVIELKEDGDISEWTPEYICDLTGTRLNPKKLWEALVGHGWIDFTDDGRTLIHDWLDTAGRYLDTKYRSSKPERLEEIANLHKKVIVRLESDLSPTKVGPPNLTLPTKPNQTKVFAEWFESLWSKYPRRDGKKDALRHFAATVKTDKDWEDVKKAVENYLRHIEINHVEPKFIKMGSTFFNNWQDWVNWQEPQHKQDAATEILQSLGLSNGRNTNRK